MTIASRAVAIAIVMALTSRARAQTAEAEALFREGKRLLDEGEIEKACEKFEASERLEEENGTELNLADCWERIGRTASAWAMFTKAAQSAKREDRAAEARRRAKRLEKKLVRLTIEVPTEAQLDELTIKRDDQVVDRALWNQAVPVDPGTYKITARAPKRERWSDTIEIRSKDKTIAVPVLAKRKRDKKPDRERPEAPAGPNENRKLALGLAIGGGGAILVASAFALHSRGLAADADAICPMTRCGDAGAVDLNRRARREGWIANIGWGLGIGALGAAVVAYAIGGTKAESSTAVSVAPVVTGDHAGFVLGGHF